MMARVYCEIELEVTGTRQPGDPSVGMGPTVEDLEVEHIAITYYSHKTKSYSAKPLMDARGQLLMIPHAVSSAFVEQLEEVMIKAIYDEDCDEEPDREDWDRGLASDI